MSGIFAMPVKWEVFQSMPLRNGEVTSRMNERMCPHIVELLVPENGFGDQLSALHSFHANLGIAHHLGRAIRKNDRDYVHWCFADEQQAKSFHAAFGGEIVKPEIK